MAMQPARKTGETARFYQMPADFSQMICGLQAASLLAWSFAIIPVVFAAVSVSRFPSRASPGLLVILIFPVLSARFHFLYPELARQPGALENFLQRALG